jgi:hypothetical protein
MAENTHKSSATPDAAPRQAGAFDIRNFIGMLIGIYGVVLVLASIFDSEAGLAKTDGVRINLWAGIGMVVTALVFFTWARLRPVVVPADTGTSSTSDTSGTSH